MKGDRDPREIFSEWLVRPENRWFTRNIANRVWSWVMGRGIIHEPDDIRPDNKPSNAALLSHLEQELIASKYDLKHLYSLILNSATYQLSAVPKDQTAEAEANFAYCPPRRLEAEVIRSRWSEDEVDQALSLAERYGIRAIANTITLYAWRNGPVEDVHAGWADGYELGARRVLPAAEKAIICQAQSGLYSGLKVVDILKYAAGWPPPAERLLPFLHPVIAPSRWSYTKQSRVVELPLRRGVQDS